MLLHNINDQIFRTFRKKEIYEPCQDSANECGECSYQGAGQYNANSAQDCRQSLRTHHTHNLFTRDRWSNDVHRERRLACCGHIYNG